jgi:molybdate transport system substrate-binding protein
LAIGLSPSTTKDAEILVIHTCRRPAQYRLRRLAAAVSLLACFGAACTAEPPDQEGQRATLVVFAAASLTESFREIAAEFERAHPGVKVEYNFAGSQVLRTQIEEGAEADVFASANKKEMEALASAGALYGEATQFASNLLTIIVAPGNPAAINSPDDLAKPDLKLVLAAVEVPAGAYAREAIEGMGSHFGPGFLESVLANVVSNEDNVRQVVAKVQLGEADAGIVYQTDAAAASLPTVAIPEVLNVVAVYPISVLAESRQRTTAAAFVEFVLSSEAQAILSRWGFGPPG